MSTVSPPGCYTHTHRQTHTHTHGVHRRRRRIASPMSATMGEEPNSRCTDLVASEHGAIGDNHHDEWIIVRNVCVADPTLSSHEGRCRQAQRTATTCRLTRAGGAIWDHVGATRPPPFWLTAVAMVSVRVVSLSLWRKPTPSHKAVRRWA